MATEVFENWSGRFMSFQAPWTARREFTVSGTQSDVAALTAVGATSHIRIPPANMPHDTAPILLCQGPVVKERKGPDFWVISCDYAIRAGASNDPLDRDAEWSWQGAEITENVDSDYGFRPILNSAGQPLSGSSRTIRYKQLVVRKNFPGYEPSWSSSYENSTNKEIVSIGPAISNIAPQHLRVDSINPVNSMTRKSPYATIEFLFSIIFDDSLGAYPFQTRLLDAGTVGWYDDSGTKRPARFSDGKGNLVDSDVRLDGTGLPLPGPFGSIKVGENNRAPVTPPKSTRTYLVENYGIDGLLHPAVDASTQAVFLYFVKTRIIDLSIFSTLIQDVQNPNQ